MESGIWKGGPIVKITNTSLDKNEDKFIAAYETPLYGAETFGQIGARGELVFDTRDHPDHARRGVRLRLVGRTLSGAVGRGIETFGHVSGEASAYLTANVPALPHPRPARRRQNRPGGRTRSTKRLPSAAPENLRGFRKFRFAGDSAVFTETASSGFG